MSKQTSTAKAKLYKTARVVQQVGVFPEGCFVSVTFTGQSEQGENLFRIASTWGYEENVPESKLFNFLL